MRPALQICFLALCKIKKLFAPFTVQEVPFSDCDFRGPGLVVSRIKPAHQVVQRSPYPIAIPFPTSAMFA